MPDTDLVKAAPSCEHGDQSGGLRVQIREEQIGPLPVLGSNHREMGEGPYREVQNGPVHSRAFQRLGLGLGLSWGVNNLASQSQI